MLVIPNFRATLNLSPNSEDGLNSTFGSSFYGEKGSKVMTLKSSLITIDKNYSHKSVVLIISIKKEIDASYTISAQVVIADEIVTTVASL